MRHGTSEHASSYRLPSVGETMGAFPSRRDLRHMIVERRTGEGRLERMSRMSHSRQPSERREDGLLSSRQTTHTSCACAHSFGLPGGELGVPDVPVHVSNIVTELVDRSPLNELDDPSALVVFLPDETTCLLATDLRAVMPDEAPVQLVYQLVQPFVSAADGIILVNVLSGRDFSRY